ncbi:hypothetical protein BAE44_0009439 [Dichanthelium oligosanthes]|uniref:F-box domain-containing protein n=1 Tax=Dichanthelium oligosanthes TaxID=888268 RepID=A0A1E5VWP3_9POAL|nr:hypothetical protein BAE44_0009439 [Dichanthelium oligosanthes]
MAAHAPPLPDDVLLEILVRLPARSIGRFRAVCRSWLAATTQPSFDRALAGRPPTVGEITSEVTFLGTNKRLGDVLKFDLFHGRWHRSGNDDDDVHVIGPSSSPSAIAFTRVNDYHAFTVHGSWDGVLCLQRRWVPPANDYLVL